MTDEEVRDELVTLLLAGHETTATAVSWAIERLVRHPDKLARLVAEIDAQREDGGDEYLTAVVNETLRVRPPQAIVVRKLERELQGGRFVLPAGTTTAISVYATNRNPRVYEDPEAFRPERFLAERTGDVLVGAVRGRHPTLHRLRARADGGETHPAHDARRARAAAAGRPARTPQRADALVAPHADPLPRRHRRVAAQESERSRLDPARPPMPSEPSSGPARVPSPHPRTPPPRRSRPLDDVALLEEDPLRDRAPGRRLAQQELEIHAEVLELLSLGVAHDRAGLRVGLDREALLRTSRSLRPPLSATRTSARTSSSRPAARQVARGTGRIPSDLLVGRVPSAACSRHPGRHVQHHITSPGPADEA